MIEALSWAERGELLLNTIATVWFLGVIFLVLTVFTGCSSCQSSTRDLGYEQYCDSIWDANPDYYVDVLEETNTYQEYIAQHGSWWSED